MVLPEETLSTGASDTCDCGRRFELEVLKSRAGYYIGTMCHNDSCQYCWQPNSRESFGYWRTEEEAQRAFNSDFWYRR